MSKFYITAHSYQVSDKPNISDVPSATVPGESYTIKEILAKALHGLLAGEVEPVYLDSEDLDNVQSIFARPLDLTDIDDLRERNARLTDIVAKEQKARADAKAAADAEAAAKAAAEKEAMAEFMKTKGKPDGKV